MSSGTDRWVKITPPWQLESWIGEIDTSDYDMVVLSDVIKGAEPDYEVKSVIGRNGDYHIMKDRYRNRKREITLYCATGAKEKFERLDALLLRLNGYATIESPFHTYKDRYDVAHNYKMEGMYQGAFLPDKVSVDYDAARAVFVFDCKPQKFRGDDEDGSEYFEITGESKSFGSPTKYDSRPLFVVSGYGEIHVGSWMIDIPIISGFSDQIVVDCEASAVYSYSNHVSLMSDVTIEGTEFPVFSGEYLNTISCSSTCTVKVYPRWWTL